MIERKAHEPDFTVAVFELVNERCVIVGQLDVIIEISKTTRLPADYAILTRLQTQTKTNNILISVWHVGHVIARIMI